MTANLQHSGVEHQNKVPTIGDQTKPWGFLVSSALLYISFGMMYGLIQGGLPPILRSNGINLASFGWTFVILVPFGLTFLWAPVVDRIHIIEKAPRIAWIVIMQLIIVCCIVFVSFLSVDRLLALLAAGVIIAFAAATMDVALDALSTVAVPANLRAYSGGVKVGSLAVGSMAGGGAFVLLVQRIGWTITFEILACLTVVATLPLLFNSKWDRATICERHERASLKQLFKRSGTIEKLSILTLCTSTLIVMSFFNRIMLVDLGVNLEDIGLYVGIGAPICGLIASIIGVPLIRRYGTRSGIILFTVTGLLAIGLMLAGSWSKLTNIAIAGSILINACSNGIFVVLCASTLGWAQGKQPATDYAVLYGASRLLATMVLVTISQFLPLLTWPQFYAVGIIVLIMVVYYIWHKLPDFKQDL